MTNKLIQEFIPNATQAPIHNRPFECRPKQSHSVEGMVSHSHLDILRKHVASYPKSSARGYCSYDGKFIVHLKVIITNPGGRQRREHCRTRREPPNEATAEEIHTGPPTALLLLIFIVFELMLML